MTAVLVTVEEFRAWAGASVATVPDQLIQDSLDEAESAMLADTHTMDPARFAESDAATSIAVGDVKRRALDLLASRNSLQGQQGIAEFMLTLPTWDPRANADRIKLLLGIPRMGAA